MRRCLRPLASMCFRRGAVDVHTAAASPASPVKVSVAASTVHVSVPGEALTAADTGTPPSKKAKPEPTQVTVVGAWQILLAASIRHRLPFNARHEG